MNDPQHDQPLKSATSKRKRWLVVIAAALTGPLLAELTLRFLLFHPSEFARGLAGGLRTPGHFADAFLEDEYWRLLWRLTPNREQLRMPPFDERLGWVKHGMQPGSYSLAQTPKLEGRRPLMLYGASFAQGLARLGAEGPELLDRAMGDRAPALVNYGVGGYGIGQVHLLMESTLGAYADADPHVALALVADSDFGRSVLDFRSYPKPRLRVGPNGELVASPVLPGGPAAELERHGIGIGSYAWRYLLHSPGGLPRGLQRRLSGHAAKARAKRELIEGIVLSLFEQWNSRGLDGHIVLCCSDDALRREALDPMEEYLTTFFREHDIPFVLMRERLISAAEATGRSPSDYYSTEGVDRGHFNAAGNRLLLEALLEGMRTSSGSR